MTETVTQVPSQTSAVQLVAANGARTSLSIANTDSFRLYWLLGSGTPSASNYTDYLDFDEAVSFDGPDIVSAVQGLWAGDGSGHANVTENTTPVSDGNGSGITTYGTLKSEIAAWLRPNSAVTADMTARIPVYIGLAEALIRRELHVRALDLADTELEIEDGVATVPTGFQTVLSMVITSAPYNQVRALPLDQLERLDPTQVGTKPYYYSRSGSSLLFYPKVDATARLRYRRGITPLSADADTNWLLLAHPDTYLFAALSLADARLIGPRLGEWKERFERAMEGVRRLEMDIHTDALYPQPSGFVV